MTTMQLEQSGRVCDMKRQPNERGGVDAGWAGLLAVERVWSGTTHRERSPSSQSHALTPRII